MPFRSTQKGKLRRADGSLIRTVDRGELLDAETESMLGPRMGLYLESEQLVEVGPDELAQSSSEVDELAT